MPSGLPRETVDSPIKRTLFTLERRLDALRGVFQPLNRREFTLNALDCPIWVLSNRTILTLSCRHPTRKRISRLKSSDRPCAFGADLLNDRVGREIGQEQGGDEHGAEDGFDAV